MHAAKIAYIEKLKTVNLKLKKNYKHTIFIFVYNNVRSVQMQTCNEEISVA